MTGAYVHVTSTTLGKSMFFNSGASDVTVSTSRATARPMVLTTLLLSASQCLSLPPPSLSLPRAATITYESASVVSTSGANDVANSMFKYQWVHAALHTKPLHVARR